MWILFLPWLLGLLLIIALIAAVKRRWKAAGALVLAVVLLNLWGEVISFGNLLGSRSNQGSDSELKVLSWNIHGGGCDTLRYRAIAKRILDEGADIVYVAECFTETSHLMDHLLKDRYSYTSYNIDREMFYRGHHIYSKFPVIFSDVIEVEGGNERIISSRFDVRGKDVDVYGCHLTSNNYNEPKMGRQNVERINDVRSLWNYMKGIETASKQRTLEAETLVDSVAARGRCALIVGDMNDICGSRPLRALKKLDSRTHGVLLDLAMAQLSTNRCRTE